MMSPTEEDFELELRSLPGVLNVEIRHRENGDVDAVTLIVHGQDPADIRVMAKQIVSLYFAEASVVVEDASNTLAPRESQAIRVALVGATFNPENGSCQVELNYAGRIGLGNAGSGQLFGGAEATLGALRDLGFNVPFYLLSVVNVATARGWPVIVSLRPFSEGADLFGIAQSEGDVTSSAMATLNALNRFLSMSPSEA
jgi:hypothetical protein